MDISTISANITAAVGAANATLNLVKDALSASDNAKAKAEAAELETRFLAINQAALNASQDALKATQDMRTMEKKITALESEIGQLEREAQDRNSYVLVDIGRQQFAYKLRANALRQIDAEPAPAYYYCQPCMDSQKKIVMQGYGNGGGLQCPVCKLTLSPNRYTGPGVEFSARASRFTDY
ncbi:hypothetical protein FHX57_003820 [Paraburkholderia tropica]|uniref:hypothetical protein n=1 Tax=Paraburkholderia tropica TaxID=92647 RepID=UPI0016198A20|nr:hypothetical protein [Paraburkholderia tropica]MBB3001463.1 hypothetical protein [Paraburkholderia tropica]MBB6324353.1 hypothetical protein [Paraburkholderia tropica]